MPKMIFTPKKKGKMILTRKKGSKLKKKPVVPSKKAPYIA